jgi:hypothetical protein
MPEEVQSRFTVYERPVANPGKCIVCGAVDRPVVDFGVDIEWADMGFGRAFFCVTCIKQAASKFPDDEIGPQVMAVDEWNSWKQELLNELAGVITANQLPPNIVLADAALEQTDTEHTQGIEPDESGSGEAGRETDESNSVEKSAGVSSPSGRGPFAELNLKL